MKNLKLRRTCTEEPEEGLRKTLNELRNPVLRKRFKLWVTDLVKSGDTRDFLRRLIRIEESMVEESEGKDYCLTCMAVVGTGVLALAVSLIPMAIGIGLVLG